MSSYLRFNGEFCKKFVKDGGIHKDAMKAAGAKWSTMTEDDKEPYNKDALVSKEAYDVKIGQLKKHGYYTLEDGSKSTDSQNAHLS